MNAELKALARAGGMSDEKVEGLVEIFGEDGARDILLRSSTTQKSADDLRISYKADALDEPADDDSELTLSSGDLDAIRKIITTALQGSGASQPGRAPVVTKSTPPTLKQLIETSLSTMGDLH